MLTEAQAKAEDLGAVLRVLPPWAKEKAETYIYAIEKCIRPRLLFHQMCSTEEMRRVYNVVLGLVAAKKAVFGDQSGMMKRIGQKRQALQVVQRAQRQRRA